MPASIAWMSCNTPRCNTQTSQRMGDHIFTILDLADKRICKVQVKRMSVD